MPRDLGLDEGPVALSESPNSTDETEEQQSNGEFIMLTDHQVNSSRRQDSIGYLHPYTRLLTISDLESCVALENAAFPIEQERASREKVRKTIYISRKLSHLVPYRTLACHCF